MSASSAVRALPSLALTPPQVSSFAAVTRSRSGHIGRANKLLCCDIADSGLFSFFFTTCLLAPRMLTLYLRQPKDKLYAMYPTTVPDKVIKIGLPCRKCSLTLPRVESTVSNFADRWQETCWMSERTSDAVTSRVRPHSKMSCFTFHGQRTQESKCFTVFYQY